MSITWCDKDFVLADTTLHSHSVLNLSSHVLTEHELSLLSKGLGFCPTPTHIDDKQLLSDFYDFCRRIRLSYHFNKVSDEAVDDTYSQDTTLETLFGLAEENNLADMEEGETETISDFRTELAKKFKLASKWSPPKGANHHLEVFLHSVKEDLRHMQKSGKAVHNVTREERGALHDLRRNDDIIIKKADKGSAVVLMSRNDYILEAETQLKDDKFYKQISEDLTHHHTAEILQILSTLLLNKEITEKQFDYLNPTGSRTARFYFLPKIHKKVVKGRPIISGNGSPTEKISSFVDEHIKHCRPSSRTPPTLLEKWRASKESQRIPS